MFGHRVGRALLGIVFCLNAGCDDGPSMRSADQRINEAFPLPAELLQSKARLDETPALDQSSAQLLEEEYQTRLRLRALGCVGGREPSIIESAEKIRARLSADCFKKADAEIVAWLNERRIRRLLAAPALRPIPVAAPKVISSTNNFGFFQFASAAGIAISSSSNRVEIVDIGTDESLFSGTSPMEAGWPPEISPNGRVFSIGGSKEGVFLQDSLTGEVLAKYPDHLRFIWLDSTSALLQRKEGGGLDLLDMEVNSLQPVKGQSGSNPLILPVGSGSPRVAISGHGYLSLFELHRDAKGLRLSLVDQVLGGPPVGWADYRSGFETNGKLLVQFHPSELWFLKLAGPTVIRVPLAGIYVTAAAPLPDPDKVLLRVYAYGSPSTQSYAIYSINGAYFSPVTNEELLADMQGFSGGPLKYIPTLDRIGLVTGKAIKVIDHFQHEARYDNEAFSQYLQGIVRRQQEEISAAEHRRLVSSGAMNNVMMGPIADLSRNARVEGVGVYEPVGGSVGAGPRTVRHRMPVNIIVRKSDQPIVLLLSSYHSVDWRLNMMPGAQLKAVLISGYEDSIVSGVGNIRVVNIGTRHAHDRKGGDFEQLQRDVIQWTGKPISIFQGKYQGAQFLVGGM